MIFATGDCHGDFQRFGSKHFPQQKSMDRDDYMIILGDFGGAWNGSSEERKRLDWLNEKPFTSSARALHPSPHRKRQGSLTPLSLRLGFASVGAGQVPPAPCAPARPTSLGSRGAPVIADATTRTRPAPRLPGKGLAGVQPRCPNSRQSPAKRVCREGEKQGSERSFPR